MNRDDILPVRNSLIVGICNKRKMDLPAWAAYVVLWLEPDGQNCTFHPSITSAERGLRAAKKSGNTDARLLRVIA